MIARWILLSLSSLTYFTKAARDNATITEKSPSEAKVAFNRNGADSCSCGKSKYVRRNEQRIIGGMEAEPHMFPWIVRIEGGCASMECSPSFYLKSLESFQSLCAAAV